MARYFYENALILGKILLLLFSFSCTNPSQTSVKLPDNNTLSKQKNNENCIQLVDQQHYKIVRDSLYQQKDDQQWLYVENLHKASTCVQRGQQLTKVAYLSKGVPYTISPTQVWILNGVDSLFWDDFLIVQAQNPSKWTDFQDSIVLVLGDNPLVKNPSQMDRFFPVKEVLFPAHTYDFLINSYIAINNSTINEQDTFAGILRYLHQPYTEPASTFLYNGFFLAVLH